MSKLKKQSDNSIKGFNSKASTKTGILNPITKSPETSIKVPGSPLIFKEVEEVKEEREDDTFCLLDESLGSMISQDPSNILSVSVSQESLLSDMTQIVKKKTKVIKLSKKGSKGHY